MTCARILARVLLAAGLLLVPRTPAEALPTMIGLGYTDCASCHVAPQGGGLLNPYGRAIDEAQSLRADEYRPSESPALKTLSWNGRIVQDLRFVLQGQGAWVSHQPTTSVFRPRLMYRNVTTLGGGVRVAATFTGETTLATRPALVYDPAAPPSSVFVNTAMLHYRAGDSLEIAVGRDQLPSGLNIPDRAVFIKEHNRFGYYDAPLQAKAFVSASRVLVAPFAFVPAGSKQHGDRESGGGLIAEADLFGHRKTVVGMTWLRGTAGHGDRAVVGGYARLGFGAWGLLAEHDVTDRTRGVAASFRQQASYAQIFWAAREWLVASLVAERLRVDQPHEARETAGRIELATRLTNQASITVSARVQRDATTGRTMKSAAFQLALKTAQ